MEESEKLKILVVEADEDLQDRIEKLLQKVPPNDYR